VVTPLSPPSARLAERYGAPSRARRPLLLGLVGVLVVVTVAWLAWAGLFQGHRVVTSQLDGYHVQGPHAATVTFTVVRRDPQVRASCLVRAFAADHAVVGELTVPVTSGPATRRVSRTVRTERRATGLDVVGCTARGQRSPH
jgi:hypothetical protein